MRIKQAVWALVMTALVVQPVYGQRAENLASGIQRKAIPVVSEGTADPNPRLKLNNRVIHFALVGAGIGAALGFLSALISTHRDAVTDHSEDGLVYMLDTAGGAVIGLIVGGIVGAASP